VEHNLRIAPSAHRDIAEIKSYIEKDKPAAAIKITNKIYNSFDDLKTNPFMGRELKKKFDIETDYRFLVVHPYIVFYKVEEDYVGVYRVLDGRSDYLTRLG